MSVNKASELGSISTAQTADNVVYGATWTAQLEKLIDGLVAVRGTGGAKADGGVGRVLPLATANDTLDALAGFVNGIKAACAKVQVDLGDRVPRQELSGGESEVTSDGLARFDLSVGIGLQLSDAIAQVKTKDKYLSISVSDYLAALPMANDFSRRAPMSQPSVFYQLAASGSAISDFGIPAARQMVSDYQKSVNTISVALATYGSNALPAESCSACFGTLSALAADLDALHDFVEPELVSQVLGASKAALDALEGAVKTAAEDAGKLAGGIGNVAGDVAGQFLKGFFSQAGFLMILILGMFAYKEL